MTELLLLFSVSHVIQQFYFFLFCRVREKKIAKTFVVNSAEKMFY